jgi:hypothetical protein
MASTLKGDYDGLPNCTDCQDPAFIARWNAALREFQAARTSLVNTMATVRTGMNPLGIFDNDAPLYFGDPQGTNSRYFAGSDYLLDGWAVPAVATAQTSLNAARDAWVAQQNSLVQDEEAQANRAHYVDQLKSTYASKILNNCGPLEGGQLGEADVLDAVKNGQIDLDTCYINPSCLGTDDVSNAAIRHQVIKQSFNADVATFNLCMWDQLKDAAPSMNPPLLPQSRIPPNNLSGGLGSPQQKVDLLTLIHPTATSFLHTQTPETGYTDISCFLEGTENQVIPRCDCGDDSGSALPSDNANACNAKTGCWTVCGPKKCQGPMGVQVCTDNTCTPEHPQGCTYPNNCLFRRDFMATNPQYHGRPPSESEMIPDMGFETHPWTQVTTQQVGNSVIVTTGLPRRTTGQNCKIPADYFYGYVPDSWHYQDLSLVLPAQWLQAYVTCSSGAKITDVMSTPGLDADVRYPFADSPLPVPEMADTCFSGAMGTSARTLRGAALQLKHSQETVSANAGHLDDVFNLCLKDKDNAQKAAEAHKAELTAWEVLGVAAAVVAAAAATYVTAGAAAPGLAAAAGYTGAAATAAAATITTGVTAAAVLSTGIGGFLAIQREQINENIAKLEAQFANDNTVQSCWNEYRQTLRNMAGLETEIEQASNTVTVEAGNLGRLKDENQQAFQDGEAKLTIEQGRKYGSYAHSYWFDDKVSRFRTEFEWSRKLTYLAMLAVEYEFQQSLPYRGDVLTAANPDKLEQVVLGLKQEQISRTVNGRRPESASTVISLRDDVLTIDDRSQITIAGERNWTPAQRFEGRLRNGGYAYYASDGTYLGQGVPFDLAPQGILEDRCGERMWRVTATIQGDGLSDTTPNAPILLLKSNTFSSQWCDTGGADIPGMQSSSVHPTTQLFRPGDSPVTSDATGFTPALMYPWFNIRRTDFYKQTYQDGSSEELAGRGLYGQYVLLFPKQLLDSGFPLEKVEDVLLRIDYLSVDNLPQ